MIARLIIFAKLGVLWAVWDVHGFWWALLYAVFADFWLAYRAALLLLGAS